MKIFPINIKLPTGFAKELSQCEEGSYNHMEIIDQDERPRHIDSHTFKVAGRWTNSLEIQNFEEAADVYYAVCSGTFQSISAETFRAACKIANVLRPIVLEHDPTIVKQWTAPWDTQ